MNEPKTIAYIVYRQQKTDAITLLRIQDSGETFSDAGGNSDGLKENGWRFVGVIPAK